MSSLPKIPAAMADFIPHLAKNRTRPIPEILEPYLTYEAKLREIYAQEPANQVLKDPYVNAVPIFTGKYRDANNEDVSKSPLRILARDLEAESELEKSKYIMPLDHNQRRPYESAAVVPSLSQFLHNFAIFSEGALTELDWSNVVCAGSAVLTSLVPPPKKYGDTKRGLRKLYHEIVAPTSDVDLFLYGLTEEQALQKIVDIEQAIKDAILAEVTTVRTKNAITICSKYPTRHVQIVLRLYSSVSEILTGFDVDCSTVLYDGNQVWATPRAIASLVTQINRVDISRRSPSYESRLAKYASRGFEIHWPELDRSMIDPTIYERSFARLGGLARLLVIEKLPSATQRSQYLDKRREERGRPPRPYQQIRKSHTLPNTKDVKSSHEVEVSDWLVNTEEDEVSNYHTLTIPYGELYHTKKIEKMLYTKDLLLNAEWNVREDRQGIKLHRHPAFVGDAVDVFQDCCGSCPIAETEEEKRVQEEDSKMYISGKISFIKDNPGRQAIGSFNPITDTDWSAMAYIGNVGRLCQAIVDHNLDAVRDSLSGKDSVDVNSRDHTGRTPLHLAVSISSPAIVACLLDHGAHITPRLFDGQTAMHLAATRGDTLIMQLLDDKSKANKEIAKKLEREQAKDTEEGQFVDHSDAEDSDSEASTSGESTVLVKAETCKDLMLADKTKDDGTLVNNIEPKDDVFDANAYAWDSFCTPMHLAVAHGNLNALNFLLDVHGSDPSYPIKLFSHYSKSNEPVGAILSLVLALICHPPSKDTQLDQYVKALLEAGAKANQADLEGHTVFEYFVNDGLAALDVLTKYAKVPRSVVNWMTMKQDWGSEYSLPLMTAIQNKDMGVIERLLNKLGASPQVLFSDYVEAAKRKMSQAPDAVTSGRRHRYARQLLTKDAEANQKAFETSIGQPILSATYIELPKVVKLLAEKGADVNALTLQAARLRNHGDKYAIRGALTLLEEVIRKRKELREYKHQEFVSHFREPIPLQDDSHCLSGLKKGTYAYLNAVNQIQVAKSQYEDSLKRHQDDMKKNYTGKGIEIKLAKIKELEQEYVELENFLVSAGAKVYEELHELTEQQARDRQPVQTNYHPPFGGRIAGPKPFKLVPPTFRLEDLTEDKRVAYTELFEAAVHGDFATIKRLATTPRKVEGKENDEPPLLVAVSDNFENNPFSLALFNGHWDTAMGILALAHAQWMPLTEKKLAYSMDPREDERASEDEDSDQESSPDDDDIEVFSRLPASVRNQVTIEDVGEMSAIIKSKTSAWSLLTQGTPFPKDDLGSIPIDQFGSQIQNPHTRFPHAGSVFFWPILKNDVEMFSRLMDVAIKYHKLYRDAKENDQGKGVGVKPDEAGLGHFAIDQEVFKWCLHNGLISFTEILMRQCGEGLPLDQLVKTSGVVMKFVPKYYQGLTIRGVKNRKWANRHAQHHNARTSNASENSPPLLVAIQGRNLESVKWLLTSNAVMKAYMDFGKTHANDERVKSLSELQGGFEQAVKDWMNTRRELVIHCAVASSNHANLDVLKHLVATFPELIDARSAVTGHTPLLLAFQLHKYDAAKILLEAGADPFARDILGNNVVHCILRFHRELRTTEPVDKIERKSEAHSEHKSLGDFLHLLPDDENIEHLFVQKNTYTAGGRTPLGNWLAQPAALLCKYHEGCADRLRDFHDKMDEKNPPCAVSILRTILEFSKGSDLMTIEGSGNTPTHDFVHLPAMLVEALRVQPGCIFRENAVGRTAAELARENWLKTKITGAPVVGSHRHIRGHGRRLRLDRSGEFINNLPQKDPRSFEEDYVPPSTKINWSQILSTQSSAGNFETWVDKSWIICREHTANTGSSLKRRLVTLNEANEIEKRLAFHRAEYEKKRAFQMLQHEKQLDGDAVKEEVMSDEVSREILATMQRLTGHWNRSEIFPGFQSKVNWQ